MSIPMVHYNKTKLDWLEKLAEHGIVPDIDEQGNLSILMDAILLEAFTHRTESQASS